MVPRPETIEGLLYQPGGLADDRLGGAVELAQIRRGFMLLVGRDDLPSRSGEGWASFLRRAGDLLA